MKNPKTIKNKFRVPLSLALCLFFAAPLTPAATSGGDPDEGGVGGTGITGIGHVQAFGSIFVNKREYFIDQRTQIVIDGKSATEKDLRLGASVIVEGNGDRHSTTAQASRIVSDHQLIGRIEAVNTQTGTLTLLGQTVHVTTTTRVAGKDLNQLTRGDAVAVYALRGGNGVWSATRVESVAGQDASRFLINARPDKIDAEHKEIVFGAQRLSVSQHIDTAQDNVWTVRGHYSGAVPVIDTVITSKPDIGRAGDAVEIEGQIIKDGPARFVSYEMGLDARALSGHISESIADARPAVIHGRVELDGNIIVERIEFEVERPEIEHLRDDIRHPRQDMEFDRHQERPGVESPERIVPETPERPDTVRPEVNSINIEHIEVERPQPGNITVEPPNIERPEFD